jgi:hypothetical protein
MKSKILLSFLIIAFFCPNIHAQYILQQDLNLPRVADAIVKQQVEYGDAGKSGSNVLWNFSDLNVINESCKVLYLPPLRLPNNEYLLGQDTFATAENLIVCHENRTNYFYEHKDSMLYLLGYQSRLDKMKHYLPVPYLKFPMSYGEKQEYTTGSKDLFSNNTYLHIHGNLTMEADAYGTIVLPSGDTMKQALRIHTVHTQLGDTIKAMDSIHVNTTIENYRWYARGYRYPVFEQTQTTHRIKEKEEIIQTAFMYPPPQNKYADEDVNNQREQEQMEREEELINQSTNPWEGMTYNVYPNPVHNDLNFELYLPKPVNNLHVQIHTPMGIVVIDRNEGSFSQGIHKFKFNVGNLRANTHYVMDFWLDGYLVQGTVILKK